MSPFILLVCGLPVILLIPGYLIDRLFLEDVFLNQQETTYQEQRKTEKRRFSSIQEKGSV